MEIAVDLDGRRGRGFPVARSSARPGSTVGEDTRPPRRSLPTSPTLPAAARDVGAGGRFAGSGVAVGRPRRRVDGMVAMAPKIGWRDVVIGPMIKAAL
jgi:hypothetical protein